MQEQPAIRAFLAEVIEQPASIVPAAAPIVLGFWHFKSAIDEFPIAFDYIATPAGKL